MDNFLTKYGKAGGHYKGGGGLSITAAANVAAGSVLGSFRWTDPDYALVITAFGFQLLTLTGLAAAGLMGLSVIKVTGFTVDDSGGTDLSSVFGVPVLSSMPPLSGLSMRGCVAATAALTKGTRVEGNLLYGSAGLAGTSASVIQSGTLYQFNPDADEPIIIKQNEGIEYQVPYGLTIPAGKNLMVNMLSSFAKIPMDVINKRYGAAI